MRRIYMLYLTAYLPPHGLAAPPTPPNSLLHTLVPFLVGWLRWIGASRPRLQVCLASAQPAALQPLDQPEKHSLPWVPGQQPVDQASSRPHDLARHLDDRGTERRELHPQQRPLLGFVLGRMSRRHRDHQGAPSL